MNQVSNFTVGETYTNDQIRFALDGITEAVGEIDDSMRWRMIGRAYADSVRWGLLRKNRITCVLQCEVRVERSIALSREGKVLMYFHRKDIRAGDQMPDVNWKSGLADLRVPGSRR